MDPEEQKKRIDLLARFANFGYTEAGSAIVDAIWFASSNVLATTKPGQIGMILILDEALKWKAYIGYIVFDETKSEEDNAKAVARDGSKLNGEIAQAAFSNRQIKQDSYGGIW